MDIGRARAVLEGLDDQQRAAVLAPVGPVRIVAGAGTGKTRTITHRIAYQVHSGAFAAQQTLAVTHSRKAASELRERLTSLGTPRVQAHTFHAAALRQLTHFWSATGLHGNRPNILSDRRSLIRQSIATFSGVHPGAVASEAVLTVDAEVTWAHAQLVSPKDYARRAAASGRVPDVEPGLVAGAYQTYEDTKRARSVLDFDDILVYTTQLIARVPQVAEQVRGVYRNFVVDEYQDTDPAQQALLETWLGERDSLCAVGDAAQTIFSFKGADPDLLLGFADRWPNAVSVELVHNYRSTPQILASANRLSHSLRGAVRLETANPGGPDPTVIGFADEDAETAGIALLVREAIDAGTPANQVAVLHRFNSQAPALRAALTDAGVPLSVRRDDEFFTRREVAGPLRALRASAGAVPDDDGLAALAEALDATGFLENEPPEGVGAARERWENQSALLEQARSLARTGCVHLADLVAELDRRAAAEHVPATGTGVTVTTIHKAKGLEWDLVVIARVTEGSLPSALATTTAERAEERRLAYVAATRARKRLHLTWARAWGKNHSSTTPSVFQTDVDPGARSSSTPTGGRRAYGAGRRPVSSPAARPPAAALGLFEPGDRILHDRHGLGTVLRVNTDELHVDFGTGSPVTVRAGDPIQPL